MSQLYYEPVVTYCIVYHYTKRAMLARLLTNKGLAIYVVHLNRYFVSQMVTYNSRATVNVGIKKILLLYSSHLGPSVED